MQNATEERTEAPSDRFDTATSVARPKTQWVDITARVGADRAVDEH